MRNFFLLVLCFSAASLVAQDRPYAKELAAFGHADSLQAPPQHPILFVGSSSFTFWRDVQNYFPGYVILNRAFGGSTLKDQIREFNTVVKPYHPKQILLYCGENDLAYDAALPVDSVMSRFQKYFAMIRRYDSKVPVVFISLKPSPARRAIWAKAQEVNQRMKKFLSSQSRTTYVDITSVMLDSKGRVEGSIFTADSLHMNAEGYARWQRVIRKYLRH